MRELRADLDTGESQALVLARETSASYVLVDEQAARRRCRALGLPRLGTLGLLLLGKQRGLIPRIGPVLSGLRQAGFYMSDWLEQEVLQRAGEAGVAAGELPEQVE